MLVLYTYRDCHIEQHIEAQRQILLSQKVFQVGHSLGALGNAYTDLSDDFLIKEMAKFEY